MDIWKYCIECTNLNRSGFLMAYAAIVLYVGVMYSRRQEQLQQVSVSGMPDISRFMAPSQSVHTAMLQVLASFLMPNTYVSIMSYFANKIDNVTGINRRSIIRNIVVFFLFYYFIVSAPAAIMVPIRYNPDYNLQSLAALLLMMLTNATGDVLSYKITIWNVKKLMNFQENVIGKNGDATFFDSVKTEISLYGMTIFDMTLASVICFFVLVLTSIYFGVSVGEYKFELTPEAISGAARRAADFWSTSWEPYWIKKDWADVSGSGWPMLLIYSVSSFIPTVLFLFFAVAWTIMMPIRIIFFSDMNKLVKIIISEIVVIILCTATTYLWNLL